MKTIMTLEAQNHDSLIARQVMEMNIALETSMQSGSALCDDAGSISLDTMRALAERHVAGKQTTSNSRKLPNE